MQCRHVSPAFCLPRARGDYPAGQGFAPAAYLSSVCSPKHTPGCPVGNAPTPRYRRGNLLSNSHASPALFYIFALSAWRIPAQRVRGGSQSGPAHLSGAHTGYARRGGADYCSVSSKLGKPSPARNSGFAFGRENASIQRTLKGEERTSPL